VGSVVVDQEQGGE
jgi:hypothetical protein